MRLISAILDRRLWERPYVDLWTVPHVVYGILAAAWVLLAGFDLFWGAVLATAGAVGWEVLEHLLKISKVEKWTNITVDIIAAPVGYAAGLFILQGHVGTETFNGIVVIAAVLFISSSFTGWLAYRRYQAELIARLEQEASPRPDPDGNAR